MLSVVVGPMDLGTLTCQGLLWLIQSVLPLLYPWHITILTSANEITHNE